MGGLDWIEKSLSEAVETTKPDILILGGDIVAHSCWLERTGEMLRRLAPGIPKIAVYGNWDKRRRRWLPHGVWLDMYRQAGVRLLVNERLSVSDLSLYGMDDFKLGFPTYGKATDDTAFNCVIAHNPDAVLRAISDEELAGVDLILCGHTHGGQWRLPLLGALARSSTHWLGFDYGLYSHKAGRTKLLVSAGIGATAIMARINCPPEVNLIELV